MKSFLILLLGLTLIVLFYVKADYALNSVAKPGKKIPDTVGLVLDTTKFSDLPPARRKQYLRDLLVRNNIPQHEEWLKVAIAESGHKFDSRLCLEQNNPFGMGHPRQRPTLSSGERRGYATFSSIEEAVLDLRQWLYATRFDPDTSRVETHLVARHWNPDMDYYIKNLRRIRP